MLELRLQEQGFEVIEVALKPPKKARNDAKGSSFGGVESSMETHRPKQVGNDVRTNHKLVQILVTVAVALAMLALWAFGR